MPEKATAERDINFSICGIAVCKCFYKRAAGINPGLFDKVVRSVLAGAPHRRTSKRTLVYALADGPPKVKLSVKAVPENLLSKRQRNALMVLDLIFQGIYYIILFVWCMAKLSLYRRKRAIRPGEYRPLLFDRHLEEFLFYEVYSTSYNAWNEACCEEHIL